MGLLFSCVSFPSPGRLGPCACRGGLRFRRGRLVQALPSSPSSAGLVPFPSASVFSSLALPGFARSGPGVFVLGVLLFPSSFAFPLFASSVEVK